jgi:hypothetical protein
VEKLNAVIAAEEAADPELRGDSITQPALSVAANIGEPALGVDEDADTTDFASLWDD